MRRLALAGMAFTAAVFTGTALMADSSDDRVNEIMSSVSAQCTGLAQDDSLTAPCTNVINLEVADVFSRWATDLSEYDAGILNRNYDLHLNAVGAACNPLNVTSSAFQTATDYAVYMMENGYNCVSTIEVGMEALEDIETDISAREINILQALTSQVYNIVTPEN